MPHFWPSWIVTKLRNNGGYVGKDKAGRICRYIFIWSAQTMRSPPALPQLAQAVQLLVGRAAENMHEGRRLILQELIPLFRQTETAIWENPDNI
jgi:hypothetical protein